jgi:Na+-transporting methylmalonyl-CoA/oxaloacetate decarboxylase gamma subunit
MEPIDWSYAISTLIIRFVGIFVVLGVLQVVMQISGRIFARIDAKKDRSQPDVVPPKKDLTEEEAAAVATALYLHEKAD